MFSDREKEKSVIYLEKRNSAMDDRSHKRDQTREDKTLQASNPEIQVKAWEKEHRALLERIAPEKFEILHYGAIAGLQVRN